MPIIGYPREELLALGFADLTVPEDLEKSRKAQLAILAGEVAAYTVESRYLGKMGELIWVNVVTTIQRTASGAPKYFISVFENITSRKRTENALRESQFQYASLFENMWEGCAHCRLILEDGRPVDFRYLQVNSAFARLTGLQNVVGKKMSEVLPGFPATAAEFFEIYCRVAATGESERHEKYVEGLKLWFSISIYSHEKDHFTAIFDDITERKTAAEELVHSRKTLRAVIDRIPQRVFWKDRNLVYIGCNDAFAQDHGFGQPAEVIGKTDYDVAAKKLADLYRADDLEIIGLDAAKVNFEEPAIGLDGSERWLKMSKIPIHDDHGQVTGVLGTYEDVTEHRLAKLEIERLNMDLEERVTQRTEDLFFVTQEAELANRAKTEFLSRTSHELRTPMNAILGFSQLLEMDEHLGSETRESVGQILEAGRHLLALIDDVLDISHAESGEMNIEVEPVPVGQVIEETLARIRPLAATLRIKLDCRLPLEHPWILLTNRQRLKQVLHNLLSNAIKYNHPGGQVEVACQAVLGSDPPLLQIRINDTGFGIRTENLPRLFKPFDRLDAERYHSRISGTGLGLPVAQRLIELLGGRIGVESVFGQGSSFWVEIPLV